jgi:hypothetical protein
MAQRPKFWDFDPAYKLLEQFVAASVSETVKADA